MSLIEQAAKRLEQLRQAGVELPPDDAPLQQTLTQSKVDVSETRAPAEFSVAKQAVE